MLRCVLALYCTVALVPAFADLNVPKTISFQESKLLGSRVNGVDRFLGIQYAHSDRFMPPMAIDKPPLNATEFGPECLQPTYGPGGTAIGFGSEDCLYLNVYTPDATSSKARPVFVWIHGGGFMVGSGNSYDGSALAKERDVVVVTINYRLGVFGFFSLDGSNGNAAIGGNLGLMDQKEALRWVQKHIHQFGGDPDDVTIFGQSAGGSSVALQVAALEESEEQLFHAAIAMSLFYAVSSTAVATDASQQVLARLNCSDVRCVQALPPEDVIRAANPTAPVLDYAGAHKICLQKHLQPECFALCSSMNQDCSATGLPFGPISDGITIPIDPLESFDNGDGVSKLRRIVVGNVRDEGPDLMLFPAFSLDEWEAGFDGARFNQTFIPYLSSMLHDFGISTLDPEALTTLLIDGFEALYYSGKDRRLEDKTIWREIAFEAYQDAVYLCPSTLFLGGASVRLPESTFGYRFEHLRECRSDNSTLEIAKRRVAHGSELPLLFDDPDQDRLACPMEGAFSAHGKPMDAVDSKVGALLRRKLVQSSRAKDPDWPNVSSELDALTFLTFSANGAQKSELGLDLLQKCAFWNSLRSVSAAKHLQDHDIPMTLRL